MSTASSTRPRAATVRTESAAHRAHHLSVGLLGDSAGFLAVAVRGATTTDAGMADAKQT